MGHETENWREPTFEPTDTVIYSEHGRSINHTDYRSHWFAVVKPTIGRYQLLVKHGGGEERINLEYEFACGGLLALASLESDARYLMLHTLYSLYKDTKQTTETQQGTYYRLAFLEGRLKRKKKNHHYYVTVLPKVEVAV